jgi:hypothetical protein
LLFQVVSDRAEKAALIITTNLPFSEWTQVFTNARLGRSAAGPDHGSGDDHRDRKRILPLPENAGDQTQVVSFTCQILRPEGQKG